MKTIKYKVIPTPDQIAKFDQIAYMLSQVWNACHTVALHNQALKWYKWAEKQGKKQGFDFDGIIQFQSLKNPPLQWLQIVNITAIFKLQCRGSLF